MASLRKKYQVQLGSPSKDDDGSPVLPPPVTGAKMPEPVADATPPEPIETKSAADQAAEESLRKRLAEMDRAEALQREQQQQPQHAEPQEPQDPLAHLPPRVRGWYERHPEFLTDPEKAAQVVYCHHVARREVGEEMTEPYFDRMEVMLGLRQQPNGHAESRPSPAPSARHVEPPREPMRAPPRQQYSAPVSREPPPSMSTGRSPRYRAPLSKDELEIAATCGQTPEQYQQQKEKWLRMKTAGEI